ncbi:MAG: reductive dehalogenase [Chloroflexi bacterium]|nr:reductive dehalogenase [Chloroflexota bacterium]
MKNSRKKTTVQPMSRRSFLKTIGLGGAALGASTFKWNFKSLEEAMDSQYAEKTMPWWVREVDEPTVEVDWDKIERYDSRRTLFWTAEEHLGAERLGQMNEEYGNAMYEGISTKKPGQSMRDWALSAAGGYGWIEHAAGWTAEETINLENPYVPYFTPEEFGVAPWDGTPEENSKTLRVALRYFGASDVGFVKLTEKTKKLIYSVDGDGREIVFEDVDQGYSTEEKKVIPNKDLWMITYTIPQSLILTQNGEYGGMPWPEAMAYASVQHINTRLQIFLRGLGYQGLSGHTESLGPAPAWGVLSGLGEMARTNRLVSPKWGNAIRTIGLTLTDMPVAVTKPIDAGIWRFCQTCKKCAESCPSGALSMADEPSWEVAGPWNSGGIKGFYEDAAKCYDFLFSHPNCMSCHAVCPYNKMDKATMHELVKISIAKMPMFNGIIRDLDDAFGYGLAENPEDFWDMEDLPLYGLDPSRS